MTSAQDDNAAPGADPLCVRRADEAHGIATWRNVMFLNWRQEVLYEALAGTRAISFALAEQHPQGIVAIAVIEHRIALPEPEVRKLASEILRDTGGHVIATATVIVGEGLWASMSRAAMATITLLGRTPHPHQIFGDVETAGKWAAHHVAPEASTSGSLAARLADLAATVRARVQP